MVRGPFLPHKLCSLLDSFLFWPPSLHLCNFSHNVFSSPLFFPSTHASIRLSILLLYFPSSMIADYQPPDHPLFCPAVSLFQMFNIRFSSLLSTCLLSHFFFPFFPAFSNQYLTSHLLLIDLNYSVHFIRVTLDLHHSRMWNMIIRGRA